MSEHQQSSNSSPPVGAALPRAGTTPVRFVEIDGMRGLGASFVIAGHMNTQALFWVWMFMDMFFVISSFLITRIVLKQVTNVGGMIAFWGRRIERIWPLYILTVWVLLLLAVAMNYLTTTQFDISLFWRFFTFSQYSDFLFGNFTDEKYPYFTIHLWSLSVEEQFYILLPLLLLPLRFVPRPVWLLVLLSAIPFAIYQRVLHPQMWIITSHIDAFALGSLMAIGFQWMEARKQAVTAFLFAGLVLGFLGFLPYLISGYEDYLAGVIAPDYQPWPATAGVLMATCWIGLLALQRQRAWLRYLRWPPIVYTGVISYALYLVHYPVVRIFHNAAAPLSARLGLPAPHPAVVAGITLVTCFVLAHLLYKFIDQRLQMGRRGPSRAVPMPR